MAIGEERILDLVEEGSLSSEQVRTRPNKLTVERAKANQGLSENGERIEVGAKVLRLYCALLRDPGTLYDLVPDDARRNLNLALFERIYLEEGNVGSTLPVAVHEEFRAAARAHLDPENIESRPNGRDSDSLTFDLELRDLFDRAG